ncbi:MAG: reverse transcriptase domain-containing protein [Sedimenticola sp.]
MIEDSMSMWHSPVVLVKKPNGSFRFAIDLRKVNKVSEPMVYPLPHFQDVVDAVATSQAHFLSNVDLQNGYWQVPLSDESKQKTAFSTSQGLFQFRRLPFGLQGSNATFQMLMTKVLKDLNWKVAIVYVDDILIFSKTFDEHLHHLEQVFTNLQQANLTLKPSKCHFAAKEVTYLGHKITDKGIKIDPANTAPISTFPQPKTVKNVRSFLGMSNYYRKFIHNYSRIAAPLNALLKKDVVFAWTDECQVSFDTLKHLLTSSPVLAFPNFETPFTLAVDASDVSIGYVLGQLDESGREHPVAYGGRSLHEPERKWHISEKEGLALVEAIRTFRPYLASNQFTVYTDNFSISYLKNNKNKNTRLMRWSLELQEYTFDIVHKAGALNTNADALSRREYPSVSGADTPFAINVMKDEEHDEIKEYTFSYKSTSQLSTVNVVETTEVDDQPAPALVSDHPDLNYLQHHCPDFADIVKHKKDGWVPDDKMAAIKLVAQAYHFEIVDGVLYHMFQARCKGIPKSMRLVKQIAVPRCLRNDVLKSYHDSIAGGGHQGHERTFEAVRSKYYWPRMYEEIRTYVQTCQEYQQSKRPIHHQPSPLQPMPIEDVFSRWHMDILSGFPTSRDGYKHVLLVVDSYSKWSEAIPLKTQETTEVAAALFEQIISRYGAPRSIISDRGQNFMSSLIQALCEMFQITRNYTSSYHPQTNATCERMNSTILQTLRAYLPAGDHEKWPQMLPAIMMAYRSTPATQSIQFSPFYLLFSQEM